MLLLKKKVEPLFDFLQIFYLKYLVGELKGQAAEKVDEAKDKASEVAADAQQKGRTAI